MLTFHTSVIFNLDSMIEPLKFSQRWDKIGLLQPLSFFDFHLSQFPNSTFLVTCWLCFHRDEGKCVEGILEIFDMLLAMTSRFRELKLQHKEYLCVKAMILLNSSEYVLGSNTAPFILRVAGKSASKTPKYQIIKNCWKRIIRIIRLVSGRL